MNLKAQRELLLCAARAPRRTRPEQHMLQAVAMTLLTSAPARAAEYVDEAIDEGVCPLCLWPLESCPACPDPEPYCGVCDTHVATITT